MTMPTMIRVDDLIISIAYLSIPIQLAVSLYRYPRLSHMPKRIVILLILCALFIFLCGTGHLLRCVGKTSGLLFDLLNGVTAFISMSTALYMLPLVPNVMETINNGLIDIALKNELEETKKKLMTFMAFLCHEIRNPLFAITSTVSLLETSDESTTPCQDKAIRSINQSACLMLRIVNDVLDLSKLESGKLAMEECCFDLRELLEAVAACTQSSVKQRHNDKVDFTFDMCNSIPKFVCGDSARLSQIVYNLLSNATKFTEEGNIQLKISTLTGCESQKFFSREPGEDNFLEDDSFSPGSIDLSRPLVETVKKTSRSDFSAFLLEASEAGEADQKEAESFKTLVLKISVSDTGPGIPEQSIDHIFEPYSQSKLSDFRKHGGTGLGLSIITQLVQLMGGSIKVRSIIGEGSTFNVYVPVRVPLHTVGLDETAIDGITKDNRNTSFQSVLDLDFGDSDYIENNVQQENASSDRHNVPRESEKDHESCSSSETSSVASSGTSPTTQSLTTMKSKTTLPKFSLPTNDGVVLVVDDNPMNCKLISRMLKHYGVQFEIANNGQEAIDKILQSRNIFPLNANALFYRLVLMDMQMPVLDGCDAIKILRRKYNVTIPILALTANALHHHRDTAFEAGATEFLTKPISMNDLHAKCSKYLLIEP